MGMITLSRIHYVTRYDFVALNLQSGFSHGFVLFLSLLVGTLIALLLY